MPHHKAVELAYGCRVVVAWAGCTAVIVWAVLTLFGHGSSLPAVVGGAGAAGILGGREAWLHIRAVRSMIECPGYRDLRTTKRLRVPAPPSVTMPDLVGVIAASGLLVRTIVIKANLFVFQAEGTLCVARFVTDDGLDEIDIRCVPFPPFSVDRGDSFKSIRRIAAASQMIAPPTSPE